MILCVPLTACTQSTIICLLGLEVYKNMLHYNSTLRVENLECTEIYYVHMYRK